MTLPVTRRNVDWTDAQIADLRRLWDEGRSASQIGEVIGKSKSAVIGKSRRIGLDGRPNPISPWHAWQKDMLRQEWHRGTSPNQIAQKLQKSTATIYAQAKRLGLPRRERTFIKPAFKPKRQPNEKSAARLAAARAASAAKPRDWRIRQKQQASLVRSGQLIAGVFGQRKYASASIAFKKCQWIEGEPSADDACKCGAKTLSGSPYCELHHDLAYRPAPREIAA